jgi:hypothetical protein
MQAQNNTTSAENQNRSLNNGANFQKDPASRVSLLTNEQKDQLLIELYSALDRMQSKNTVNETIDLTERIISIHSESVADIKKLTQAEVTHFNFSLVGLSTFLKTAESLQMRIDLISSFNFQQSHQN